MEGGTCIVHSMGDEDRWKWGGRDEGRLEHRPHRRLDLRAAEF